MQRCASSSATWIGQQQLWFGQREAVLLSDPDDLHEKLALAVNIRQLDPLPTAGGFLQRSAIRIAGDIGQAGDRLQSPILLNFEEMLYRLSAALIAPC